QGPPPHGRRRDLGRCDVRSWGVRLTGCGERGRRDARVRHQAGAAAVRETRLTRLADLEVAAALAREYAAELQPREVGGAHESRRALDLSPHRLTGLAREIEVHVREDVEVGFLELQRALDGVAEQVGAV